MNPCLRPMATPNQPVSGLPLWVCVGLYALLHVQGLWAAPGAPVFIDPGAAAAVFETQQLQWEVEEDLMQTTKIADRLRDELIVEIGPGQPVVDGTPEQKMPELCEPQTSVLDCGN